MSLSERITLVREKAGLNQQEFAKVLKISPAYVSFMEKGLKAGKEVRVSEQMLVVIGYHFGVSVHWLKNGGEDMYKTKRERLISEIWRMEDAEIEAAIKIFESLKMVQSAAERARSGKVSLAIVK